MSKVGFVLFLRNEAIGIYDDFEVLNNFINGCLQNGFFSKDDIKTKKYNMNSVNCLDNKLTTKEEKVEEKECEKKEKEDEKKKECEKKKEDEKKKEEIEGSEEYKNLTQMKIDTKHMINELKKQKKKLEEEKQSYEYDLKMYEKLKIEKGKIENFEIPEIFTLKFNIFEKLETSNHLNFEVFKTEWEKVKPKNNYSLFSANPYEISFTNSNTKEEIDIEIDI